MYELKKRILYSDIDDKGYMLPGRVATWFQDCINAHSQDIDRGIDYMVETGRTWFLVAWNIEIKRLPQKYENMTLATWGYDYKRSLGFRNVTMKDEAGEVCACGDSLWSMVDLHTGKPLRINDDDMQGYIIAPKYENMTYLPRKIEAEGDYEKVGTLWVRRSEIDYNGHMSNDKYIDLACEFLPEDFPLYRIRGEYKAQTKYRESMDFYRAVTKDRVLIKMVGEENGEEKCVVEFSSK